MINIAPAFLEEWMREYYFSTEIDIGSSGVQSFSMQELRELLNISQSDIDRIVFDDSWSHGDPGLRDSIAKRWTGGNSEKVLVTHGSSEAIYLTMHALLEPGDEVIALEPSYQQLFAIAEAIGCTVKFWPLRFDQKFVPDIDELRKLMTPRTKMVVANFPHNPTGASVTLQRQNELINTVAKAGVYLIWDGAFSDLTYDAPPLPDPGHKYERSISLGTLSKAYGLPGLRVGWCTGQKEVLDRCVHLRDYITLHLSPLVELIARHVIDQAEVLINIRLPQARTNLGILSEWMDRNSSLAEWVRPNGGVCAFVKLPGVDDVKSFCHLLGRTHKVMLVPGTNFNVPGHVRLGFGGSTAKLKEGLDRLYNLLSATAK